MDEIDLFGKNNQKSATVKYLNLITKTKLLQISWSFTLAKSTLVESE